MCKNCISPEFTIYLPAHSPRFGYIAGTKKVNCFQIHTVHKSSTSLSLSLPSFLHSSFPPSVSVSFPLCPSPSHFLSLP